MKKIIVSLLVSILLVFFLSAVPASARHNRFWPGLAIGLGSALVLGNIFYPPRADSYYSPSSYYHGPPPAYYPPASPSAQRVLGPGALGEGLRYSWGLGARLGPGALGEILSSPGR